MYTDYLVSKRVPYPKVLKYGKFSSKHPVCIKYERDSIITMLFGLFQTSI